MDNLAERLQREESIYEKITLLNKHSKVEAFFKSKSELHPFFTTLTPEKELVIKQLIAIGQFERISRDLQFPEKTFCELLEKLVAVDAFYREMGGIIGYHEKIVSLMQNPKSIKIESIVYHSPSFIDISEMTDPVLEAVFWGIEAVPDMAEIYPLGGAADRLHLVDEETGMELPAARLLFAGRALFSGLIRDLQAREFLHFKLFGNQAITPIGIMTSKEKDNHLHILQIAEDHQWFGRPKESFRLFVQPLVPVVNQKGQWCLNQLNEPVLKPGGHGAIWKLARDTGVFSWMGKNGRKKALIRQINNPMAGIDHGLLAFTGIGWKKEMKFGFASCPRLLEAAEGMVVLVGSKKEGKNRIALTNVEYCDFAKCGIEDRPLKEGEPYSRFSSNTNILFADLNSLKEAVDQCPYPGLLVNLKGGGDEATARLESTMQNIADVFAEEGNEDLQTKKTFVTYNQRKKTISTAKKAYVEGRSLQETPENCFYDLMSNARALLEKECFFELPFEQTLLEMLERGPNFVFLYHPALGPLYSVIKQKLQKGRMGSGSELELEISDLFISNLTLEGSLRILAERPMGHLDEKGVLRYSNNTGRCFLKNVSVCNQGVDWEKSRPFWRGKFKREESLEIVLKGRSELVAENVFFQGARRIEVEDGVRLTLKQQDEQIVFLKEPLEEGPFWHYRWEKGVVLDRHAGTL